MQDIWKNKDKSVIKYYIYDQQHSWKKCDLTGDRTLDHQFHAGRSNHLSYQVIWLQRSVKNGYIPTQHTSSPVLPSYTPDTLTAATPYHNSVHHNNMKERERGVTLSSYS